jgi:hypothetical protein
VSEFAQKKGLLRVLRVSLPQHIHTHKFNLPLGLGIFSGVFSATTDIHLRFEPTTLPSKKNTNKKVHGPLLANPPPDKG